VLAKSAVAHLVGTIFGDSALAEPFQKLFCTEEWQQGTITGSILATLGDYFDDFKQLLEPTFFKRCAPRGRFSSGRPLVCGALTPRPGRLVDLCLEEGVAHFVAALVTYARNITDASLEAIQRDHDDISRFFEAYCSKERVRARPASLPQALAKRLSCGGPDAPACGAGARRCRRPRRRWKT